MTLEQLYKHLKKAPGNVIQEEDVLQILLEQPEPKYNMQGYWYIHRKIFPYLTPLGIQFLTEKIASKSNLSIQSMTNLLKYLRDRHNLALDKRVWKKLETL